MEDLDGGLVGGLLALAAVVEFKSFGRAASRLGKTQPAVSRAIQRLEDRLRTKLVHRTSRHVEVTDAGHELLSKVLPLLQGIEEATNSASDQSSVVNGTLRVACDAVFARLVLAPELTQFLKDHPALQLKLETRNDLSDLVSDGFDLAIRFGPPSVSALVCRRLYSPRVLTVAAPSYLERRGRPQSPKDLVDDGHECILAIDPATGRPFEWEFWRDNEKVKVAVRGNLTVTDAGTKIGACLAGYGIAQVIDLGIDMHLRAGTLEPVLAGWPDETFPLYVYYPSRHHVPAKVRAFIDFVAGMMPGSPSQARGACRNPALGDRLPSELEDQLLRKAA
ncbi:LysR family transcriptional regulator [Variovorax sp. NFACC27]|uniref:LysR family transcriptional regulator n=1 Tax=unclassified Variovorax TaxID=663243 RepID=UPI00089CF345|nr:LysR family transcriptional regulator [Variovorax sp. YR750]MDP9606200.1 DNA-binding transcriptional LysR family regulator [Variovorax paradoxus]SEF35331.1 DNA-binding transcriptional regulator, LysR family [Variovorax sp. NFACC28]SEG99326.1 DNA-binding transcriptional regulator, LysR family [Variovorax sp. NFACC29]SFE21735.1 DNA-binding transcriptional regulator, LysR family [Variovorax sp. NFACC26]SFH26790.1 DNA-binding transcriptional regulator, LysR family [Variovorax sp. NFACC27]